MPILPAIAVGLVAFMWLNHVNPPFIISDDGVRDQLLARDCIDLGRCHGIGAVTSLSGIHHGPVWHDMLIAVRLLGGGTTQQRTVVLALMAVSAATLFVVVWRWLRPALALPAAVLLIGAMGADPYPSLLTNPSMSALPDMLTACGLLCYGLSGWPRFLMMSAFSLGAGISVHVATLSLVVPLLLIVMLVRRRPWRDLAAALAIVVVIYGVTSSAALRANALALARPDRLMLAMGGAVAIALLAARGGARFRGLSWEARAWVIGVTLLLPFALAVLWLVGWEHHHVSVMYLHPILGPAAVLGAALLALPFELGARWRPLLRWIPTMASVAAIALVASGSWRSAAVATAPGVGAWMPTEATAIAAAAAQRGWSYDDLIFRVQSAACRELLTGMAIALPAPTSRPNPGRRQLQVVKVSRNAVPALTNPHDVMPLGPTTVAIVREIDSWLRPDALTACREPADGRPPRCAPALHRAIDALGPERYLFSMRAYPDIHSLDLPRPYTATYAIPLAPIGGATRDVVIVDSATQDCGWRVTRAEGVQLEGELPARRVRVHSESGAPGLLVLAKLFGTSVCPSGDTDMRYPPCVFEAPPGDSLQALVGSP